MDQQGRDRLRSYAEYLGVSEEAAKDQLGELYLPLVLSSAVCAKIRNASNAERKVLKASDAITAVGSYFRFIVLLEDVRNSAKFRSFWTEWDTLTYSRRKDSLRPALEWNIGVLRPSIDNPDFVLLSALSENKLDLFQISDPSKFVDEPLSDFLRRRKKFGSEHLSYYLSRILVEFLFSEKALAARDRLQQYADERSVDPS